MNPYIIPLEIEKLGYTSDNGLVVLNNLPKKVSDLELLHIDNAKRLGVTAVFFRRTYNNLGGVISSKPTVYIFEKTERFFQSPKEQTELHSKLWSAGEIDVYFIVSETHISIYNARKPSELKDKELSIEKLAFVANKALQSFQDYKFSAYLFGNGTFWEQTEFANKISKNDAPYTKLLNYLKETRKELRKKQNNIHSIIDKLLLVSILIKFLEGKKIEDVKDESITTFTLQKQYEKYQVQSFAEILRKNNNGKTCLTFLEELSGKFENENQIHKTEKVSGKVFDMFSEAEKELIKAMNLEDIAKFVEAKTDLATSLKEGQQTFFWEQYSFNYLPIELISAIYESFLEGEKSIAYTPIHVVNLLVDEVMPLDKAGELFANNRFKVLDPTCGSGVFLVATYKRMLQWWAINRSTPDKIQYPNAKVSQEILENNIFGVDVKETATLITIFSLTIAFLDKLEPKVIWNDLKFKNLSQNIKPQNFFEWAMHAPRDFDLVIGNPPFNVEKGKNKKEVVNEDILKELGTKHTKIADSNFAMSFFEVAMTLGRKQALILPSHIFLYNNTKNASKYRSSIFADYTIEKIYDFTHLRRVLFSADSPVCAVIATPEISEENSVIEHIVVKRTLQSDENKIFEIDSYDYHFVELSEATDENLAYLWKCNLLAPSVRLFDIMKRLKRFRNLEKFVEERQDWIDSVGYKESKAGKKYTASYLTNKKTIKTDTFDEQGNFELFTETAMEFSAPRNPKLFEPPLLVIKALLGKNNIPVKFLDYDMRFKDRLFGISAPNTEDNKGALQDMYNYFHEYNKLTLFFLWATSGEALVGQENTVGKDEILQLPYPENKKKLELTTKERIIQDDVLGYYIHAGKSPHSGNDGWGLNKPALEEDLEKFGDLFCKTMNQVYAQDNGTGLQKWQVGKVQSSDTLIIYQFQYGKHQTEKVSDFVIEQSPIQIAQLFEGMIKNDQQNRGTIFNRVGRVYTHEAGYDCIYLIKPKANRYWLQSIALYDVDETIYDYTSALYLSKSPIERYDTELD